MPVQANNTSNVCWCSVRNSSRKSDSHEHENGHALQLNDQCNGVQASSPIHTECCVAHSRCRIGTAEVSSMNCDEGVEYTIDEKKKRCRPPTGKLLSLRALPLGSLL